ncbi:uncharacterized protein LOC9631266 [Selaginella moellendorffii]|nr:uncharacterized protein LOC9631266 [Selaginella moellendorffii]|eukprot:XP_002968438.2 uncharacterized protein LOC9631266 [Selaginella moellendorffii]
MAIVRVVGVVGAGQMGTGIAQLAAAAQMAVVMADSDGAALTRGLQSISSSLAKFVKKGVISEDEANATLARVSTTTSLADMSSADVVIEAVSERENVKKGIFSELDRLLKPSAILASNTSSISITRLAASTQRPQQVIGMHFMNPPPLMKLVEIVRGLATADEVFEQTKELAERFGKTVVSSRDFPGFVVNRILMPMINEAFYALLEGVSSAEEIDTAMKLGTNQPMGPLALADFIGLDTCLSIMGVLHAGLGDAKYRPCPLLAQYVDAGWLGRKSGRGVYHYLSKM